MTANTLSADMSAQAYHADPAIGNSMLSSMAKSPAHFYALHRAKDRQQREETTALSLGQLAHTIILEPHKFDGRYIVKPEGMNFSTKAGKAWRDDVPDGVSIVAVEDVEAAHSQRDAIMRVGLLRSLITGGIFEASAFWTDKDTGLRCKARPDCIHDIASKRVTLLDLKTISDLTPDTVQRAIARYGYHRQDAHYTNGVRECGYIVEAFVFGFVSSSYPYVAGAFMLDDESKAQGQAEIAQLLGRVAECEKSGRWPAFGDGINLATLPPWAKDQANEVEIEYA